MITCSNSTAATPRMRTRTTQASPFGLRTPIPTVWGLSTQQGTRLPSVAVVRPILADHNSINASARYGAAKQAAPPRGVPR